MVSSEEAYTKAISENSVSDSCWTLLSLNIVESIKYRIRLNVKGAGGIRAASWAARIHSWIGNVRKGSLFARLTSMAMKEALSPGAAYGMRAIFQVMYVGGAAAESCKKDLKMN